MARMTINISEPLNDEMREYIEANKMTITTFLHLAISRYLEGQEQTKKFKKMFAEMLNEELKREKRNE